MAAVDSAAVSETALRASIAADSFASEICVENRTIRSDDRKENFAFIGTSGKTWIVGLAGKSRPFDSVRRRAGCPGRELNSFRVSEQGSYGLKRAGCRFLQQLHNRRRRRLHSSTQRWFGYGREER